MVVETTRAPRCVSRRALLRWDFDQWLGYYATGAATGAGFCQMTALRLGTPV
jgi:hypothetical protein